tara:strand:- start:664 stop:831 length:168 start_codon:yes stop_codon:yes gene_type:complete
MKNKWRLSPNLNRSKLPFIVLQSDIWMNQNLIAEEVISPTTPSEAHSSQLQHLDT